MLNDNILNIIFEFKNGDRKYYHQKLKNLLDEVFDKISYVFIDLLLINYGGKLL